MVRAKKLQLMELSIRYARLGSLRSHDLLRSHSPARFPLLALGECPLQQREVALGPSRVDNGRFVPVGALGARTLQQVEVAELGRGHAGFHVPGDWWVLSTRPLQHLEVSALGRSRTGVLVPHGALGACPLQ